MAKRKFIYIRNLEGKYLAANTFFGPLFRADKGVALKMLDCEQGRASMAKIASMTRDVSTHFGHNERCFTVKED